MSLNADRKKLSDKDITLLKKHFGGLEEIVGEGYTPRVELDESVLSVLNLNDKRNPIL
jgi:hypothetical protein